MSVDGSWNVTLSTPMGPQSFEADLRTDGNALSGTMHSPLGSMDISGTVNGNTLQWSVDLDKPMPITVDFDVAVDGDAMRGNAKLGMFGSGDVTGTRA